ncbi:MAG: 3-isopropylmalate dehydrogenase [Christensenellales bacterium]|jgi:3-isopropylmalate dehydrogenase
MDYKIAVLPGDGIGVEVTAWAVRALEAAGKRFGFGFTFEEALMGGCAIDATGDPLPQSTLELCKAADATLLGAVGGYKWENLEGNRRPEAGLLRIRAGLGLYANLRPAMVYKPLADASPLKREVLGDELDLLVVRELTGGIYFGRRGRGVDSEGYETAYDTEEYSVKEIRRIARVAFDAARKRGGKLTSVDKSNVLESSRLWREVVVEMGEKEYPDVALSHMYVDNAAMQLVYHPRQFDVIVTSNIFGDILSDEASMITGSIGMLPSASLGDGNAGMYEPVHGSAPDIAGKDVANPLATILSAAMLLRYSLGQGQAADAVEDAVRRVLQEGWRTADIARGGESIGTRQMGTLVEQYISA